MEMGGSTLVNVIWAKIGYWPAINMRNGPLERPIAIGRL